MNIFESYINAPVFVWDAVHHTIAVEGDYVDNPDDTGGATRFGITKKTALKFKDTWSSYDWNGDMQTLPEEFAADIYTYDYYLQPNFDIIAEVSQEIAKEMFDTGVNLGKRKPSLWCQEFLNVMNNKGAYYDNITEDGYIGQQTQTAFAAYVRKRGQEGLKVMYNQLNCLQGAEYHRQAKDRTGELSETFIYGWLQNRVDFK